MNIKYEKPLSLHAEFRISVNWLLHTLMTSPHTELKSHFEKKKKYANFHILSEKY